MRTVSSDLGCHGFRSRLLTSKPRSSLALYDDDAVILSQAIGISYRQDNNTILACDKAKVQNALELEEQFSSRRSTLILT